MLEFDNPGLDHDAFAPSPVYHERAIGSLFATTRLFFRMSGEMLEFFGEGLGKCCINKYEG